MYIVQDRATGEMIEVFNTYDEAEKCVRDFEADDKFNGIYEEGFYEIKEA